MNNIKLKRKSRFEPVRGIITSLFSIEADYVTQVWDDNGNHFRFCFSPYTKLLTLYNTDIEYLNVRYK